MLPEHQRLTQIRDLIRTHFDLGEVKDLCFDLGISYDDLPGDGEGKASRVRELVAYCERNGLAEHLLALCQQRRPHVNWPVLKDMPQQAAAPVFVAPTIRNPRQIFISHAHQDAEFAQRLAADLRRAGWDIWIAPDSIRVGEQWVTAVNRGLEESSVFVLVLTPDAARSSWVRRETDAAIHLEHQGEVRFIPLDVKPTRRPPLWQTYQWVSFNDVYHAGLQHLLRVLISEPIEALAVTKMPKQVFPRERGKIGKFDPSEASPASLPFKTLGEVWIPGTIPQAGQTRTWDVDGKVMVYVPAGEFMYGDNKKNLYVDGFWIDKTPVTNSEYKRFLDANPQHSVPNSLLFSGKYNWDKRKRTYPVGKENHPIVMVSWHDAQAYAQWTGKRLPTEQEWEKAARGTSGLEYPWGKWRNGCANTEEEKIKGTSPVEQYSPRGNSPYGCLDMCGNVWEWTNSWWDETEKRRVLRGGSWGSNRYDANCSTRFRFDPSYRVSHSYGFRMIVPISVVES